MPLGGCSGFACVDRTRQEQEPFVRQRQIAVIGARVLCIRTVYPGVAGHSESRRCPRVRRGVWRVRLALGVGVLSGGLGMTELGLSVRVLGRGSCSFFYG